MSVQDEHEPPPIPITEPEVVGVADHRPTARGGSELSSLPASSDTEFGAEYTAFMLGKPEGDDSNMDVDDLQESSSRRPNAHPSSTAPFDENPFVPTTTQPTAARAVRFRSTRSQPPRFSKPKLPGFEDESSSSSSDSPSPPEYRAMTQATLDNISQTVKKVTVALEEFSKAQKQVRNWSDELFEAQEALAIERSRLVTELHEALEECLRVDVTVVP